MNTTIEMNTTESRVKEMFAENKFGAVDIVTKDAPYLRGISNSDVLPTFKLGENMMLEVTTYQHDGEKISSRKGFGWVHTNFQCALAEKQRAKYQQAQRKYEELKASQTSAFEGSRANEAEVQKAMKARDKAQKKLCNKHNAQYGCSNPCGKCLGVSKDRQATKIRGNIFFRNGYGASSLDFVYFAIVKTNSEGVPMLYVRRRPASSDFLSMSAQDYQKNYVAKNKHIKNSFCICIYKPPEPQTTERKPDLTGTVQSEVAGSQNLPAVILPVVIGQTMPVLAEAKA